MADIGNIDNMIDVVVIRNENPLEQILKQVRPQIADMCKVIDGWTASVDANLSRSQRFENTDRTVVGIK